MPTHLPWPLAALPRIHTAGRFPHDDRDFAVRYSSQTHAVHLYDYAATLRLGRSELSIGPGDLTLTPAGVASRYHVPTAGRHWCVHFSPVAGAAAARLPLHVSLGGSREYVTERLLTIARLFGQSRGKGELAGVAAAAASAALQELLLSLSLLAGVRAPTSLRSDLAAGHAASILSGRFDQPLSVPGIAREVGLTQNYLARRFRKRFGMTMPRYLLARRIDYSRHLLLNTDLPIHLIAQRVGMPDLQHFNKQFRRLSGASPSAIRSGGPRR